MREAVPEAGEGARSLEGYGLRPEPRERLDPRAKRLWRISAAISSLVMLAQAGVVSWLLWRFADLSRVVALLPVLGVLLLSVPLIGISPDVRWRRWRYEITEHEVDLQRGFISVVRTLVPLTRVEHVDTQQGPLERSMGLSTVVFHTAAGAQKIPALATPEADRVRDRIAELARGQDER